MPTLLTAAETMAPPGTKGAATAAPWATALPAAAAPFWMRLPKESFGVWRASVTLVSRRSGVGSMRLTALTGSLGGFQAAGGAAF